MDDDQHENGGETDDVNELDGWVYSLAMQIWWWWYDDDDDDDDDGDDDEEEDDEFIVLQCKYANGITLVSLGVTSLCLLYSILRDDDEPMMIVIIFQDWWRRRDYSGWKGWKGKHGL